MTPKEKATELVNKYFNTIPHKWTSRILAKKCALIAVSEKIDTLTDIIGGQKHMWSSHEFSLYNDLQEVKQEITKQ